MSQESNNQPTFQRSPHDRKNPYTMVSNEMIRDKSISPKAKGVLLYLLHLPNDWKIYHTQLMEALGIGEEYLNSALKELIDNGYATRTRERIKGVYQPYSYMIYEFKISLPNRVFQPGFSGPENPDLQSTETIPIPKEPITQTPPPPPQTPAIVNDGGGGGKNISLEDLEVIDPKGNKIHVSSSTIFSHFLKYGYCTEIIKESIEIAKRETAPITAPLKYLESICKRLSQKAETKKFKKKNIDRNKGIPPKCMAKGVNWYGEPQ